ncbi:hypothetical protein THAOC_01602 [Thalassiosira oceanica]|uniref:Uncharacterized protein n=1 Tax=Thalassiosira oceanica TaxID=159749 RepID=K0TGU3_THAOC|nr:hypothetical protein THAOC_01602 [Thalassiosira oceanica]|eukprot:EJK76625.1 hypothetical protein THAOC_01602 [Thalassiosira oceanica]
MRSIGDVSERIDVYVAVLLLLPGGGPGHRPRSVWHPVEMAPGGGAVAPFASLPAPRPSSSSLEEEPEDEDGRSPGKDDATIKQTTGDDHGTAEQISLGFPQKPKLGFCLVVPLSRSAIA